MELGHFSVSLNVADLAASIAFYKVFGFEQIAGEPEQNWIILGNGQAKIGLFHGMFKDNLITFNPPDARKLRNAVQAADYKLENQTDFGDGPNHFVVKDPDGNTILVDQHDV